jgi:hypothetical protein
MFAMKPGNRNELVENADLLCPAAPAIPLSRCPDQLVTNRHADPPHRRSSPNGQVGSNSVEAIRTFSGAFQARQCAHHGGVTLAKPRSGYREQVFMITGIGVHDRLE